MCHYSLTAEHTSWCSCWSHNGRGACISYFVIHIVFVCIALCYKYQNGLRKHLSALLEIVVGVKQYGSSPYCILYCNILPYCNIWLDFVKNHFMGTFCTQLHMFYVANKAESQRQALIITFMHLFVILFVNILQYIAICNISIFSFFF